MLFHLAVHLNCSPTTHILDVREGPE